MDYQRLIFAAHVNRFAQDLYRSARAEFANTLPSSLNSEEHDQKITEWESSNAIRKYFALAYRQLLKTADIVDETQVEIDRESAPVIEIERPVAADIRTIIADGTAKPSE